MPRKRSIRDVGLEPGTRVLLRVDYNVPFVDGSQTISDDSRIVESLPTIRYLREHGCAVIVCTHRGRPGGRRIDGLGLSPVARHLSELIGSCVTLSARDFNGDERSLTPERAPGSVHMLENLRFHPGEEANDPEFARGLARLADIYVNDGFGVSHRRHASTAGVAKCLPSAAGLLLEREIESLTRVIDSPDSPYAVVLGGAKVADKIPVINGLADAVDTFMIGGGMVAAFLAARDADADLSTVSAAEQDLADEVLRRAATSEFDIQLPRDVVVADSFTPDAEARHVPVDSIPSGYQVMDIGPATVAQYAELLGRCRTIVWNGPMGVCEWKQFASGTEGVAAAIAAVEPAFTVIGGGSTAAVVTSLGLARTFSHVSTGGGAALEFLEGRELPGIAALDDAVC